MTTLSAAPLRDPRTSRSRTATDGADAVGRWLRIACLVACAIGIGAALTFYAHRGSLWEDELIAITHANQPLPSFFVEMLRNDIHPPLWFLQLDGWLALGPATDGWALANSLLWAAISLATMFAVARTLHGVRAAWIATALLAVLPNFAWSAGTLRMYAAIPACVLFVYFANRRWFDTRRPGWLVACLVAEVAVAYVHAVEFYFVAFIVAGALIEAAAAGNLRLPSAHFRRSVRMWLVVQVVVGACLLPLAASALLRGSDASAPDSAVAMLSIGGGLVVGWKTSSIAWLRYCATVVFVLLVGCALADRGSRWRTLVVPIGALLVAVALALLVKPIYKQPVFSANLLPFVVLGAAAAAARFRGALAVVAACIVVLAIAAFPLTSRQAQAEAYAGAARSVQQRAVAGDVVVVPNVSVFWGIARYAIGPQWGRPLAVMSPPNAQWAGLNARIAARWGAEAPKHLGLVPETHVVDHDGVRYVLGSDAIDDTAGARHVWVVTRERYQVDVRLAPAFRPSEVVAPEVFGDGELMVRRFDRSDVP